MKSIGATFFDRMPFLTSTICVGILTLGVSLVSWIVITSACVVVNKHFDRLEFVFNSVYVDQKYNEHSLTFTAGSVCLCVCVVMRPSLVCL